MIKTLTKGIQLFVTFVILSVVISSCSSTKKVKYFQDIPDSGKTITIGKAEYTPLTISSGDILNVTIQTLDPLTSGIVNGANATPVGVSSMPSFNGGTTGAMSLAGASSSQQPISGYPVAIDGSIELPLIGKIQAAGYTTIQLRDTVYNRALRYYKEPIVQVRFANFKVDVTGEVAKPGQYIMPDEKETIFDALSMAGDLTIFAKRENVLLVRQNTDGTKSTYRINLKKSDAFTSPVYYLKQNDVIYVEPRKAKSDATDAAQTKYVTIAAAVLSLLIILATRAK